MSTLEEAATEMDAWFREMARAVEASVFSVAPDGAGWNTAVTNVLVHNARTVRQSVLDDRGALYQPLCFAMVAAHRKLDVPISVAHWRAALRNVLALRRQLEAARAASESVGLVTVSAARVLKDQVEEALAASGFAGEPSAMSSKDRSIALGVALNWELRFLLAYATECELPAARSGTKDLAWIADLMRRLDSSAAAQPSSSTSSV